MRLQVAIYMNRFLTYTHRIGIHDIFVFRIELIISSMTLTSLQNKAENARSPMKLMKNTTEYSVYLSFRGIIYTFRSWERVRWHVHIVCRLFIMRD